MRRPSKLLIPILFSTLSFQTLADQTPIQKERDNNVTQTLQDAKRLLGLFTFPSTRSNVGHAIRGSSMIGPLHWFLVPFAVVADSIAFVLTPFGEGYLLGKAAYSAVKNKMDSLGDDEKLSTELKLFRDSMQKRSEQAERLIGDRFIKTEDLLPFTLGFTAIHSFSSHKNELVLVDGQRISEKDLGVFPESAQQAFRALVNASHSGIKGLPENLKTEEAFMRALVERMTYAQVNDVEVPCSAEHDKLDEVISDLRLAAKMIDETLKAL